MKMPFGELSLLAGDTATCPVCGQTFSPTADDDNTPTNLACGHSVCFKCIQLEWCKSVSSDVDTVCCPVCRDQVMICFEGDSMKSDQPLEPARKMKTTSPNRSDLTPTTSTTIGCNVLISNRTTPEETFQNIPLTNSLVDMQQLGADVTFSTSDMPVDLEDKSWPMDLMNIHSMLEKKSEGVDELTPHIGPGSMFSDPSDSDIGSVQDILKIVNMPGDSLLDDCSLNAFFSNEEASRPRDSLRSAAISVSEFSDFSEFFQNPSASSDWGDYSACHGRGNLGVDGRMKSAHHGYGNPYTPRGRSHKRGTGSKSGRQSGAMTRRRYVGRGYRRTILSPAARLDGLYLETCSAVASIQDGDPGEKTVTERLASVKENLHDRFYPKTNRKQQQPRKPPGKKSLRKLSEPANPVVDLQMVKIMSDINIPEKQQNIPVEQEYVNKHNYGYVTNSMLSDGNEITNLYVVPKTWLNCDEIEVQFIPNGMEPEVPHPVELSMRECPDIRMASSPIDKQGIPMLPTTESLVQYFPKDFLDKTLSPQSKCSALQTDQGDSENVEFGTTQLPDRGLISGANFESKMVHANYDVNNSHTAFIPESHEERQGRQTLSNEESRKGEDSLLSLELEDGEKSNAGNVSATSNAATPYHDRSLDVHSSGFNKTLLLQNGDTLHHSNPETIDATGILNIGTDGRLSRKAYRTATGAENGKSSESLPLAESSSLLHCSELFSSTESVKPEDLHDWYKSNENSEHPFDVSAFFGLDDNLSDKAGENGNMYKTMAVASPLVRGSGTEEKKRHPSSTSIENQQTSPYVEGGRLSKCQIVHGGSKDDGGSPKLNTNEHPQTSANVQSVWISSHAPNNGTRAENQKNGAEMKQLGTDKLLTELLIQIKELDTVRIIKQDIRLMSSEIYKLVKLGKRRIERSILQMIRNQVSTVVSCAKSMHCLDNCQMDLVPDMKENLHMQMQMLRLIVSRGVAFIVELISVCELRVDREQTGSDRRRNSGGIDLNVKQPLGNCIPQPFHLTEQTAKSSMSDESKVSEDCSGSTDTCSSDTCTGASSPPVAGTTSTETADCGAVVDSDVTTVVSNNPVNMDIESTCAALPSFSEVVDNSRDGDQSCEDQKVTVTQSHGESDPDYNEGEDYSSEEDDSDDQCNSEENVNRRRGNKRTPQSDPAVDGSSFVPSPKTVSEPSSTPKKRRTRSDSSAPQDVPRFSKIKTPTKGSRGKKKIGRRKDVYESSSEEIIPVRVKRGFQYTEECFKVFNIVYNHSRSGEFCKEIKSSDVPGYYKVIKRAMWLHLIAHKLRLSRYDELEDFVADMRLVFSNSRLFNTIESEVYESGVICEKLFEETLANQFPDKRL